MQTPTQPVPGLNGTHEAGTQKEAHAHVEGAFVFSNNDARVREYLERMQQGVNGAYMRWDGRRDEEHERIIRGQSLYLVPARNEELRIASVLHYLTEMHRVPVENVLVMNASSTDKTAEVARSYGVEVQDQADVLPQLLEIDRFLEFQRANSLKQIAGKGMTLMAGLLHMMASGKLNKTNAQGKDMHVVMLDSDPRYGDDNGYDPLSSFAELRKTHGAQTMKPAKNGPARNNHPVYIATNALGILGPYARSISSYLGRQQWLLSGEMSRDATASQALVMSGGYPVETTMNISDHDLGLRIGHYADHRRRGDTENDLEKEEVMYDWILRTLVAVIQIEQKTGKRLTECGIADIAQINRTIAGIDDQGMPWPIHLRDERNDVPEPIRVILPEYPRVIGSIGLLAREKIAKVDAW